MTPVRLEPAAFRSRVKLSTTEPLRSLQSQIVAEGMLYRNLYVCVNLVVINTSCADPEGDRGPDSPAKLQNIGFLSNIGPNPLKIQGSNPAFEMLGHRRPASKTPFKWRFVGGSLMAR